MTGAAPLTEEQAGQPAGGHLGFRLAVILTLLFLALKIPFLLYSPYTIDEEEFKPGPIGYILMNGSPLPIGEFVIGGYEGGAVIVALCSIPFQMVFGNNHFAYKMLSVCVSLGILLMGAALLARISGRRAALFAGLLYIFSPPYITQFQFMLRGNYVEDVFLTLFAMLLFHRIIMTEGRHRLLPFLMGVICGLGFFIHYGFAVTPLAIVFLWYLFDHRLPVRAAFWIFLVGILAGLSPWIWYNLNYGMRGLERLQQGSLQATWSEWFNHALLQAKLLVTRDLAMTWHFRDVSIISGKTLSYLYYAFAASGFIGMALFLRREILRAVAGILPLARLDLTRTPKHFALILPVFIAGFFTTYCISGYGLDRATWGNMDPETHAHILIPLFFLLLAMAFAAGSVKHRLISYCLLVPPLLLAGVGNIALLDFSRPNMPLLTRHYTEFIDTAYTEVGINYGYNQEPWQNVADRLDGQPAISFHYGLGKGFGLLHPGEPEKALAMCEYIGPYDYRNVCVYGIGAGVFEFYDTGRELRDGGMARLSGHEKLLVTGGAADILINLGFVDHPLIEKAREYFFSEEFVEKYPDYQVRHYMQSRLHMRQEISVKE